MNQKQIKSKLAIRALEEVRPPEEDAYEDDNGIDETDIIALQKADFEEVYESDNNIDETDIIQISQFNEDEVVKKLSY